MAIIDFHTHAFPDNLAEKAMSKLRSEGNIESYLDGRISSLLSSMDKNKIKSSVICSIATKPDHFFPILEWSKKIVSKRIIPFLSIHPEDRKILEHINIIKKEGFKGVKLHPYYQNFVVDDEKIFHLYEKLEKAGLILLLHAGNDIAFAESDMAGPERIANIRSNFSSLKLIAAHLGGWKDWDRARKYLIGKDLYLDLSISTDLLINPEAKRMILAHPPGRILFGTDSPWVEQSKGLEQIRSLSFDEKFLECIFFKNAFELLGKS